MLWLAIKDGHCGESIFEIGNETIRETLRTAAMAWFSTIVDKNGLNIFPLWEKMFPQYQRRIALYRAAIQPELDLLRAFRDRATNASPVSIAREKKCSTTLRLSMIFLFTARRTPLRR
jgi:hypothetical protein